MCSFYVVMGKRGKNTSFDKRQLVVYHNAKGKTQQEIANILDMSKSTVGDIIRRFRNENRIDFKTPKPRPNKLSDHEKHWIHRNIVQNPKLSAPKLVSALREYNGNEVHAQTVRRALHERNFHGRSARKKPYISEVNRKKRLEFAKQHINKDESYWNDVIFADETKINLFGSDGRTMVLRKANEELNPKNLNSTIKHGGGSLMLWGCISAGGVGNMTFINGIMNKEMYLEILKQNLKQSAEKLGIEKTFKYYQDNDPKHTAEIVRLYLIYNCPKVIKTPPQSPDLNPIENCWSYLKTQVRKRNCTNIQQMKSVLQEEWEKIDSGLTKKLVGSMKKRLQGVIDSKGYPTKY